MFVTYSNIKKATDNLHQVTRSVVLEIEGIEGYVIKSNGDSCKDETYFVMQMMENKAYHDKLETIGGCFTSVILNSGLNIKEMRYMY